MKIGLLGCDDTPQRFRHLGGTYRDMFGRLLAPHLPALELEWFDVLNGVLPDRPDACEAYICTGSRYSVYDDRAWIRQLEACVRSLQKAGKPFVGVCFGHQVLAQALGGEVTPAEQGWGVGVHEMNIVQREPWMEPALLECSIQYMHADQVQRLPPGSVVLAAARHCPVAMFRVGETMLGIEGHPEFPAAYVGALVEIRKERIGVARADAALEALDTPVDDHVVARWIANFVRTQDRPAF